MNKNDIQNKPAEEVRRIMEENLLDNPNPTTIDIGADVCYAPNVNISQVVIPCTLNEEIVLEGLRALMDASKVLNNPEVRKLSIKDVEKLFNADLERLAHLYCRQLPSDEMYLKIANESEEEEITEGYSEIVSTEGEHVAEFLNLDALYRQYGVCVQSALAVAKMLQAQRAPKNSNPPTGPSGFGE